MAVKSSGQLAMTEIVAEFGGSAPHAMSEYYGGGDKDFIPTLKSGKTIILSPPDGNSLQFVRVTADGGINVYKAYREPVAMPGMMGS